MKIAFVSNYFNHHQKALSDAFNHKTHHNYAFITTQRMDQERRSLGWNDSMDASYVMAHDDPNTTQWLKDCDVILAGSAPEHLIRPFIKNGKIIFRYSERPLKDGPEPWKFVPRRLRWNYRNPTRKPIYLLAASAFAPLDYSRFDLFTQKSYQWGYFPENIRYSNIDALFERKNPHKILWAGRLIEWKHPDDAILMARKLKEKECAFELQIIGDGERKEMLKRQILEQNLSDVVTISDPMKPEAVRRNMEEAGIYLLTSDRYEGWGAVLNESMNSGCAVVASDAPGSVPYLIRPGQNGLVYPSGNVDYLTSHVMHLLEHPREQRILGEAAYQTINYMWNANVAAERLIQLSAAILEGNVTPDLFAEGPCAKADIIREDWYIR